jgi:hypothetical protein
VLSIVANALKHSETDDFVSYINTMYNNHLQGVKTCTVDELLLKVEKEYITYVSAKKWKAKMTSTDESVFFLAGVFCYGCGKEGHIKPNCPTKGSNEKNQGRGGRGRGRGRGGGRGRGRSNPRGQRVEKDKTPPKTGESHTRQKEGVTQKWCGICGYWTWGDRAHDTKDCPNKKHAATANTATQDPNQHGGSPQPDGTNNDGESNRPGFGGLAFVAHAADF